MGALATILLDFEGVSLHAGSGLRCHNGEADSSHAANLTKTMN
jgi:hypothetical protein